MLIHDYYVNKYILNPSKCHHLTKSLFRFSGVFLHQFQQCRKTKPYNSDHLPSKSLRFSLSVNVTTTTGNHSLSSPTSISPFHHSSTTPNTHSLNSFHQSTTIIIFNQQLSTNSHRLLKNDFTPKR